MKLKFLFFLSILFLVLPIHSETRILVTSSLKGNYEACYCQLEPISGIELRSKFLQNYRKKFPNAILLETGNLFSKETTIEQGKKILDSYQKLEYKGISLGSYDFLLPELIQENEKSLPFLGNFSSVKQIKPFRMINTKEGKIFLIGWASPDTLNEKEKSIFVLSTDSYWDEIQKTISKEKPDLKILLGNILEKDIKRIKEKTNFTLAVIEEEKTIPFEQSKDVFQFGKNGEHIGEFVFAKKGSKWKLKSKKLYSLYKNQKIE